MIAFHFIPLPLLPLLVMIVESLLLEPHALFVGQLTVRGIGLYRCGGILKLLEGVVNLPDSPLEVLARLMIALLALRLIVEHLLRGPMDDGGLLARHMVAHQALHLCRFLHHHQWLRHIRIERAVVIGVAGDAEGGSQNKKTKTGEDLLDGHGTPLSKPGLRHSRFSPAATPLFGYGKDRPDFQPCRTRTLLLVNTENAVPSWAQSWENALHRALRPGRIGTRIGRGHPETGSECLVEMRKIAEACREGDIADPGFPVLGIAEQMPRVFEP